jgi:hypothetical protein
MKIVIIAARAIEAVKIAIVANNVEAILLNGSMTSGMTTVTTMKSAKVERIFV